MPTENEIKFLLDDTSGALEAALASQVGLADLEQLYMRGTGHAQVFRRRGQAMFGIAFFIPTPKRAPGRSVVLETPISEADFARLSSQKEIKGTSRIRSITEQGARITRRLFTIKVDPCVKGVWGGNPLEIEFRIDKRTYETLSQISRSRITKKRATVTDGPIHWDVDFLKDGNGKTYIAMAEAEMPEGLTNPPRLLPIIDPHIRYAVPKGDKRFNNAALSDHVAVRAMVAQLMLPSAA